MADSRGLRVVSVVAAASLLAGCIVSRVDTARPDQPLPEAFPATTATATLPDRWWQVYADPVLDGLVEAALASNADAALAAARVLESQAALRAANAGRSPAVTIEGSAARNRDSELSGQSPAPGESRDNFSALGVVSYELDLWGRYARASEAARARLLQSGFDRDAVLLSLTGEVVRGHFALVAATEQLERARETLAARRESVEIERLRSTAGESDEATLRRTEAEAAASSVAVQQFELEVANRTRALGVLLGRSPRDLAQGRFVVGRLPDPPVVPAGLPSSLLERRPDIRAAEAALVAAAADMAVARTRLFPAITLTGTYGSASEALGDLFTSPATQWSLAGGLLQPVFQAGRLRAELDRAEAVRQQRAAEYVRTVQGAFRDVLDALDGQVLLGGIRQATADQAGALARAAELSELRYAAGEIAYLELLDVRRSLFEAQIAEIGARRDALLNSVSLALALGGGVQVP